MTVFITIEKLFIEKLIGPMEQARQDEVSAGIETAAKELREQSRRTSAVKTTVVIEQADPHQRKTT